MPGWVFFSVWLYKSICRRGRGPTCNPCRAYCKVKFNSLYTAVGSLHLAMPSCSTFMYSPPPHQPPFKFHLHRNYFAIAYKALYMNYKVVNVYITVIKDILKEFMSSLVGKKCFMVLTLSK